MKHAVFPKLSIAFALLFSLWGSVAHANDYDDVNLLLRQGKSTEALAKADTYIAGKPRDPQMRFLRGVILTEQNKQAEAIIAFTQLTQDFPELPEPYNNLAALYASQSKFDQARAALESALKLNPNYATAHENLGDVYARLAAQEYVKAQQFASTNASVAPKLVLIRQIFSSKAEAEAAALPAAPPVIRKPVGRSSK
ncbi:tetratricopeptide repeat protein [Variovorax sp. LT1R20]|uniref:tetratricopeptide repeat protein n=1 Tax=Variovorax sp. LT1R20 TaxID=3443729 RepID=UPI003F474236